MFCKTYTQFYAHFSVDCVFFLKLIKQVKSPCELPLFRTVFDSTAKLDLVYFIAYAT